MKEFFRIVNMFPERLREQISSACKGQDDFTEIRLRSGRPISIVKERLQFFVRGENLSQSDAGALCVTGKELMETLQRISGYSVYARQREIDDGYFTICGGHRVGVCSSRVGESSVNCFSVSSVNIRVAQQHFGCSNEIFRRTNAIRENKLSFLLYGEVLSGKTTVLRDSIRRLASAPHYKKISLIDERKEIAAVWQGLPSLDVGVCTDILDCQSKLRGVEIAVRSLSPDIIACDEIGNAGEIEPLLSARLCGVNILATAHAKSIDDLKKRNGIKALIENGVFDYYVQIGKGGELGSIGEIHGGDEL